MRTHLQLLALWNREVTKSMKVKISFIAITSLYILLAAPAATAQDLKVDRVMESQIAVNSTITVVIVGLDKWLQQPEHDWSKFVLYLDGNQFPDLKPAIVDGTDEKGTAQKALRFDLLRTSQNRMAWTAVFGRRREGEFSNRNVTVTLQHPSVRVLGETSANLRVVSLTYFFWFIVFAVAFAVFFWFLCYKTDMIRVPGAEPAGNDAKAKKKRKPYSLARTQMAFWFFAAIVSYGFIWIVTGYQINIPTSVLTLIGISVATGLSSAVVDSSKRTDQQNTLKGLQDTRKALEADAQQLQSEIKQLNDSLSSSPPMADTAKIQSDLILKNGLLTGKQTEMAQTDADIAKITAALQPIACKNFISDVLSDDDGVSFHRLQIFAWTMILILIFVVSVYDVLSMPDFDTTLLALMGISGGTYIGFKLPNQQG